MPSSPRFPGKLKERKPPFWISVNLSNTFKTRMEQDRQFFCVIISRRKNEGVQPIISYMVYLIMVDINVS